MSQTNTNQCLEFGQSFEKLSRRPEKYVTFSRIEKKQIIEHHLSVHNESETELLGWIKITFNKEIKEREVQRILNKKFKEEVSRVKIRELDEALFDWFGKQQELGIKITDKMLQEKAKVIQSDLNICEKDQLTFSNGWIDSFKKRHGIKQRKQKKQREKGKLALCYPSTDDKRKEAFKILSEKQDDTVFKTNELFRKEILDERTNEIQKSLNYPTVSGQNGSIPHYFSQLSPKDVIIKMDELVHFNKHNEIKEKDPLVDEIISLSKSVFHEYSMNNYEFNNKAHDLLKRYYSVLGELKQSQIPPHFFV